MMRRRFVDDGNIDANDSDGNAHENGGDCGDGNTTIVVMMIIIMMITVVVAAMAKVMIIIHFLDSAYEKKG